MSIFVLAMMNVAIILSLRGLPLMAKEGPSLIFYLLFSLCVFLVPTALISAELASGWPEHGGVFRWVKEAFGERVGFTAIWLQWIQNIFWYPTVLSFAGGTMAYLFMKPELAENKLYNMLAILFIYWGSTLICWCGLRASGRFSSIGALVGTILPGLLIIVLGAVWWLQGRPIMIASSGPWIPDFTHFSNLALMGGIILLFAGIEVNAVHVMEVVNPNRSYPKAIFLSVLVIFTVFFLGSLSIAAILPPDEISLTAGLMQAFTKFLALYHMDWLVPILGLFISFGVIGSIAAWIVGPSKGLLSTAHEGLIPPLLSKMNKNNVPTHILIIQGVIVTLVSQVYLIMPSVNTAFFLLSDLTIILYLTMYLFLFTAALTLRYKRPNTHRAFKIPFGNFGIWVVGLIGLLGALFAITIAFFPPAQLKIGNPTFYVAFLALGWITVMLIPQLILALRKPEWKN